MKLHTLSSAIALTCIIIACKSSSPILRDVSRGVQNVDKTVQEVNRVANNVQRTKADINRTRGGQSSTPQTPQRGNRIPENTPTSGRRREQSRPEKVAFVLKCISGDCENGTGIKEYEYIRYEGQFKNGQRHGHGKLISKANSLAYFEGTFANDLFHGKGTLIYTDGTVFQLTWNNGEVEGLGKRIKDGLSNLGYWDSSGEMLDTRGLTFSQLKAHQDTTFAKFKKCNCLERKDFGLPRTRWVDVPYEKTDPYTGEKETGSNMDIKVDEIPVKGYINNKNYVIYVRSYLKKYYKKRNVYEYIDDSFVAYPGEKLMANRRRQPKKSFYEYFSEDYVYLGQYCGKSSPNNCK